VFYIRIGTVLFKVTPYPDQSGHRLVAMGAITSRNWKSK